MTDREKLIELLDIIIQPGQKTLGDIADHLIASGVTLRKTGRWIEREHDDAWGRYILLHCDKCDCLSAKPLIFCPSCGAKMEV